MFWIVRGTDERTGKDIEVVVEAECRADAEYKCLKQGIPVVIVEEANQQDVWTAKREKRLWRYSQESRYTCLGRPLSKLQLTLLMLCGLATLVLLLRVSHVPMKLLPRSIGWSYATANVIGI